jgi:cysteine desulfurase / selenocysteine lyase
MDAMNVDALAFTGHKSLMGSTGIGGSCVRRHVEVRQLRSGGTGVRSADPYHPEEYPWRLEYGTPNMVGVAALSAGQDWLESNGLHEVHSREMLFLRRLVDGLREIAGVRLYCCEDLNNHLPTLSMNIDGVEASHVGRMLATEHKIATRTGLHCAPLAHEQLGTAAVKGTVRFSIGPFNTAHDIDAAITGVAEIARGNAGRSCCVSEPVSATECC